ncbi:MAG: helix-hairpin-helix domain-containing protein [Bacilli bacterium]
MKPKWKIVVIISVVVVLIMIGLVLSKEEGQPYIYPINQDDDEITNDFVVEVKGEVNRPGLYFLNSNARINDAIILAGGFTFKANTEVINLASKVTDGMVIFVPSQQAEITFPKISINQASLNELMEISGIGEIKARNIITYRNNHGMFHAIEELLNVEGISQNLFDQIKDDLCL